MKNIERSHRGKNNNNNKKNNNNNNNTLKSDREIHFGNGGFKKD